jgi:hypothetical protein
MERRTDWEMFLPLTRLIPQDQHGAVGVEMICFMKRFPTRFQQNIAELNTTIKVDTWLRGVARPLSVGENDFSRS